jgi:hypothetical protein
VVEDAEGKLISNLWDMPAVMFKGTEQRMRYGLFKDLVGKHNYTSADAAKRGARYVL